MPIYEYECPKGTVTERMTRRDTREITCPECGRKARRIISVSTFQLKGGGWYADGYASKKPAS
jgi:putative FmdB family regulatory protein